MTILHIAPSYKPAFVYGGPTRSIATLCEYLAQTGSATTVFTTTANGKSDLPKQKAAIEGVEVIYHARWTGDHGHFSPALLGQVWLKCRRYDIVHIHSWWNWVAIISVFICKLRGVHPIFSPRGMLSPYSLQSKFRQAVHNSIGRWLLRGTVAHFTSEKEQREGLAYLRGWPFFTVANIIELPVYQPPLVKSEIFTIVFVGRLHPVKRLEMLISALGRLKQPFHFIIIGEGEEAYMTHLKNLVAQKNLLDNVIWMGWIDGKEKGRLLSSSDLFALTSATENFANAALEALSVGTPVFLTSQIGLADYVRTNYLGWICEDNAISIAKDLEQIITRQKALKSNRATISSKIKDDFAPSSLITQYLEHYKAYQSKQQG